MQIFKTIFKLIGWFIISTILILPAFINITYFMSGYDKELYITTLQQIPADKFWIYPLMMLSVSGYLIVQALKRMYAAGYGEDEVDHKKVEEIKELVMSGYLNKK